MIGIKQFIPKHVPEGSPREGTHARTRSTGCKAQPKGGTTRASGAGVAGRVAKTSELTRFLSAANMALPSRPQEARGPRVG